MERDRHVPRCGDERARQDSDHSSPRGGPLRRDRRRQTSAPAAAEAASTPARTPAPPTPPERLDFATGVGEDEAFGDGVGEAVGLVVVVGVGVGQVLGGVVAEVEVAEDDGVLYVAVSGAASADPWHNPDGTVRDT